MAAWQGDQGRRTCWSDGSERAGRGVASALEHSAHRRGGGGGGRRRGTAPDFAGGMGGFARDGGSGRSVGSEF